MASNSKYENNIILKEEALLNLLTNIKNYPIIDIDAIESDEADELHGDNIWANYTSGAPCIKVTYGNDRTTKGNVIFASTTLRREIRQLKRDIETLNTLRNNLISQKNRWIAIFNENKKVYDNKDSLVLRLSSRFEEIAENKLKFLKAGWDLLYYNNDININLYNFEHVSNTESYNNSKTYYFKNNEDEYELFTGTQSQWNTELNNNNIYIDAGPVVTEYLGPEAFTYYNITLNSNDNTEVKVNIQYTRLNLKKSNLLSKIDLLINTPSLSTTDKEIVRKFRNFINVYNNLAFLDAIGLAGYTQEDIENLKEYGPEDIKTIIAAIEEDVNWEETNEVSLDFDSLRSGFRTEIETIVNTIKNIINENLTTIRNNINTLINDIDNIDSEINNKLELIEQKEEAILDAAENVGGSNRTMYGYKYVTVGDNVGFNNNYDTPIEVNNDNSNLASGTFRVGINNKKYEVPIKGFGNLSNLPINLSTSANVVIDANAVVPITANSGSIGTNENKWNKIYATTFYGALSGNASSANSSGYASSAGSAGYASSAGTASYATNAGTAMNLSSSNNISISTPSTVNIGSKDTVLTSSDYILLAAHSDITFSSAKVSATTFTGNLDGTAKIANSGSAAFTVGIPRDYIGEITAYKGSFTGGISCLSITATSNIYCNHINATSIFVQTDLEGATFVRCNGDIISLTSNSITTTNLTVNGSASLPSGDDYAEYRPTIDLTSGHAVIDQDDGTLAMTTERLLPGASIISDTFSVITAKKDGKETPLALAGRVLAYPYQDRSNYHAGMAVCSAPDGTVDIMTREEIRDYPDCIIGIVSEIPTYEVWGTKEIQVDGRIWIKIK